MADGVIKYSDLVQDDGAFDELQDKAKETRKVIQTEAKQLQGAFRLVDPEDIAVIEKFSAEINKVAASEEKLSQTEKVLTKTQEQRKQQLAEQEKILKELAAIKEKENKLTKDAAKNVQEEVKARKAAEKELEKSRKALEREAKARARLQAQVDKNKASTIAERQAQKESRRERELQVRADRAAEGSVEQLRAQLSLVTIEWKNLSEAERENGEQGQRLVQSKLELTNRLKDLEKQTGDTRRNVGNYTESLKEAFLELNRQDQELRENIAALRKQQSEVEKGGREWNFYEQQVSEAEKELEQINGALGRTSNEAKGLGSTLEGVGGKFEGLGGALGGGGGGGGGFSGLLGGLGKAGPIGAAVAGAGALAFALGDVTQQFTALRGEVNKLTGETGAALDSATVSVRSLGETFGEDQKDILLSVNTLSKEFGISTAEALELVETGFLSNANASGELLDSIREYSTQIRAAGGDAGLLINILNKSGEEGIFSDKGIDVVKEFGLRITEQTTATQDALKAAFGEGFTNELLAGVRNGTISSVDALKTVSKELGNIEDQAKKQTVIADVFGGPGEDAGARFLESLQNISSETGNLVDESNELVQQNQRQLESEENLARAQNELSKAFFDNTELGALWNDILAAIIDGIIFLIETVDGAIQSFKSFGGALTEGFGALFSGDFEKAFESLGQAAFDFLDGITELIPGTKIIKELAKELGFAAEESEKLTESQKNQIAITRQANTIQKQLIKTTATEAQTAANLFKQLKLNNSSRELQQEVLDKLVEQYPELLEAYESEEAILNDLDGAQKLVIDNLVRQASEQFKARKQTELFNEILEKQADLLAAGAEETGALIDKARELGVAEIFGDDASRLKREVEEASQELTNLGVATEKAAAATQQVLEKTLTAELDRLTKIIEDSDAVIGQLQSRLRSLSQDELARLKGVRQARADAVKSRRILLELDKLSVDTTKANTAAQEADAAATKKRQEQLSALLKFIETSFAGGLEGLEDKIAFDEETIGLLDEEVLAERFNGLRRIQEGIIESTKRQARELGATERELQQALLEVDNTFLKLREEAFVKFEESQKARAQRAVEEAQQLAEVEAGIRQARLQDEIDALNKQFEELDELTTAFAEEGDLVDQDSTFKSIGEQTLQQQRDLITQRQELLKQAIDEEFKLELEGKQRQIEALERLERTGGLEQDEIAELKRLRAEEIQIEEEVARRKKQIDEQSTNERIALNEKITESGRVEGQRRIKEAEEAAEREKEIRQELVEELNNLAEKALDKLVEVAQKEVELQEQRLEAQQDALARQQERAEQGLENSLAAEKELLARRQSEVLEAQKQLERREKARALFQAYQGYAQNGSEGALQKTLRDFTILETIARSFGDGGIVLDELFGNAPGNGIFHGPSHASTKKGIPIMVEGNEGILSVKEMDNLGRKNFYDLKASLRQGPVERGMFKKQRESLPLAISAPMHDPYSPAILAEMRKQNRKPQVGITDVELVDKVLKLTKEVHTGNKVQKQLYERKVNWNG